MVDYPDYHNNNFVSQFERHYQLCMGHMYGTHLKTSNTLFTLTDLFKSGGEFHKIVLLLIITRIHFHSTGNSTTEMEEIANKVLFDF